MTDTYEPRLWLCNECGFVLGVVLRDSSRRAELNVFRNGMHIVNVKQIGDLHKVTYATIIRDGDVTCATCGARRTWRMSDQAMDDLLARRKRRYSLEPA